MVKINDVAKKAGVSVGTVSNILNGAKNVSFDKIIRVEEAIRELGYQPDNQARNLKKHKTNSIGIVLPNITDPCMAQLYMGIEKVLSEKSIAVNLYITSDIAQKEQYILEQIQRSRLNGVALVTCQPNNTESITALINSGVRPFLIDRDLDTEGVCFWGFDNQKCIFETVVKALENGKQTIAIMTGPHEFSAEKNCVEGYKEALGKAGRVINNNLIEVCDLNKESAFRSAFRLLQVGEVPDLIITSSVILAEGILEAISICQENLVVVPQVAALCEESWTSSSYPNIIKIKRSYFNIGEMVGNQMMDQISNTPISDNTHTLITDYFSQMNEPILPRMNQMVSSHGSIKVLMMEGSASYATQSLLADFKKKEGISVEIDTLDFPELYDSIINHEIRNQYDVLMVDVPWLPEMVESGILLNLDEYIQKDSSVISELIPGILDVYAKYQDSFYVLPYMFGTQILYYRKDLFEDTRIKRMFYEQNNFELRPPKTWIEYNIIARFFTEAFNPLSPTKYGTTLGGQYSSGAVCEFLPRLWAFGGQVIDHEGQLVINTKKSIKALKNYTESYQYAIPGSSEFWWDEQVRQFKSGAAAMMILFMSHATDLTDRHLSEIAGKIGCSSIPGQTPLLGGWSLGINSTSKKKDLAFKFIKWTCDKDMAIPSTILGGSTPCVNLYNSAELINIYPWLPISLESFYISQKRLSPKTAHGKIISEMLVEKIIGEAVHSAIVGNESPENAILKIEKNLRNIT